MDIPALNHLIQTITPAVETHKPVSIPPPELQSMIPLVKPTEKGEVNKQSEENKSNAGERDARSQYADDLFVDTELKITVSKEGQTFIRIIDSKTQEVINEIPPEKLVKILSELRRVSGLLFNKKA